MARENGGVPLPGATSAKVGLRYEDRWTAHCALKILGGEAQWIYLERVDTDETGFEFDLALGEFVEHHQVKRQTTSAAGWRLRDLSTVLQAFGEKLNDPGAQCIFASGNSAQALDDLSTDARKAEDWQTFERAVLTHNTRKQQFDDVCKIWQTDEPSAFLALGRVRVATIGEQELTDWLAMECEQLLEGPVATAPSKLMEILRDRVNERVTAGELWSDLEKAGLRPNPWRNKTELAARIRAVNERFVTSRESTLIAGQLLSRPEARQIRDELQAQKLVFVEGDAGAGKSDVLLELVRHLEADATSHLAFRLDRWEPTDAPQDLGKEMNLPVSPPAALEMASAGSPCVLIIDQLDVVSTTSGRQSDFLDCVSQMIRMAATHPPMAVVLACRSFDARNDARLRQLRKDAPVVPVGQLEPAQVDEVLTGLGVAPAKTDATLRDLLRVPLHLAIFSQISPVDPAELPALRTIRDLYREFWKVKRRALAARLQREPHWVEALQALVEHMSNHAVLRAPREILDVWEADLDEMLSASVLVEDRGQVSFFHETFFDYVFARLFFSRGRTVRDLLLADQLLFRRAQVRQLLAYERDGAMDTYIADLRHLLFDDSVRFHIRDLVLSWLASVDTPFDEEWEMLDDLLDSAPEAVTRRVRDTISRPQWFIFLDAKGLIEQWLADETASELALQIIAAGQLADPARAAALLAAHRQRSDGAVDEVSAVLQRANLAESRETFDLFMQMLEADERELGSRDFFHLARDLPDRHPDWGCELIAAYLRNRLRAADEQQVTNPFDYRNPVVPRELYVRDLVVESARGAPRAFVQHVLPQMLAIVERTAERSAPPGAEETVRDAVWHSARMIRNGDQLDDDLLDAAEAAVATLASDDPEAFLALVEEHRETEYETVCALLFGGFRANAPALAEDAARFVLADVRRLSVGQSTDDHRATRQLLEAITPHCSTETYERLEQMVLGFFSWWERSSDGRRARGLAQFTLLDAMAADRRSELGRRRLQEWQRKFGALPPREPSVFEGGFVGSPIPPERTRKMKDRHWLRAFERYATDDSDRRDFLKGGAHQLSNELEAGAREDPVRFVGLAQQMPDTAHVYYYDAILRGVAGSDEEVPLEATRALVERCHALPPRPCGRWIAQPLRRHVDGPLPADLVEILTWYATNDPDPPEVSENFSGDISDEQRMELQGLNSVRGSIAYEIAPHIHHHEANVDPFAKAVESLASDPSAAVRAMAARTLSAVMRYRPERAVQLFLSLSGHPDDRVLAGREAHEFLRFAGRRHFDVLRPVIERMIDSEHPAVRTCGAVHAALVALDGLSGQDLAERCMSGDAALRRGVARVDAANIRDATYRERCEEHLIILFNDADAEVRADASKVFRELTDENFAGADRLVGAFLASAAFDPKGADTILLSLESASAPPPALSLRVCNAFLSTDWAERNTAGGGTALYHAGELAIRAYADAAGDLAAFDAALDIIDRVLALDTFRLSRVLTDHERYSQVEASR